MFIIQSKDVESAVQFLGGLLDSSWREAPVKIKFIVVYCEKMLDMKCIFFSISFIFKCIIYNEILFFSGVAVC